MPDPADFEQHEANQKGRLAIETMAINGLGGYVKKAIERLDKMGELVEKNPTDAKLGCAYDRIAGSLASIAKSVTPLRQMRPLSSGRPLQPSEQDAVANAVREAVTLSPEARAELRRALDETDSPDGIEEASVTEAN